MRRYPTVCLVFFMAASNAYAALPGNSQAGQRVHAANCTGCHDTSVYVRKNRRVGSLDGLKEQLQACSHQTRKELSPSEKENLLRYLNDQFYQFN